MPRLFALAALIVAAVFAAGLCKVADLDFWWHLRTGKLIVDERAIPHHDVYSYTALGREYVDHEWLFQVIQWGVWSAAGPAGVAIFKSLVFSATFVLVALYLVRRHKVWPPAVLGLIFLAIAGGITRLIERPEMFSTLFAVLTFMVCEGLGARGSGLRKDGDPGARSPEPASGRFPIMRNPILLLPLICMVWANIHAAVIVGLLIQGAFIAAAMVENRAAFRPRLIAFIASVGATCLNPVGVRVLSVPFELTSIIDSGVINNAEWRSPTFRNAPFFYVSVTLTIALLAYGLRRAGVARLLIGAFLAFISLRYIRNIGLFCTFMPLLLAPEIARWRREPAAVLGAAGAGALLFALTVYYPFQRGFGEASYFPDGLVRYVDSNEMEGRMLNSYGIGGYLIWKFYPERLVFIDGRNEVYLPLLQRLQVARGNSREWLRLLNDYRIEFAVLEYVDKLDRVTVMAPDGSVSTTEMPVSVARFPRTRWALVHWDDDGMILVRRDGANAALTSREYAAVVPEGRGYLTTLVESGAVSRELAVAELQRKLQEDPGSRRARGLLAAIQNR
ncbi:MAG TPA: hypothetical protein VMS98_01635 [Thermoanaerobaculia bacterium]|nr:hypothetical protein [Thermoanaerobaculia bacterium]